MSALARTPSAYGATLAGALASDAPLARHTWFRVGGPAEFLAQPADADDLCGFLAGLPPELPVMPLGAGSNLIVRDGGVPGIVIRLGRAFAAIERDGDGIVAGGAAADALIARRAGELGIAGLEFLAGIPGLLGGAVAMNAGAYGGDVAQVLDWAEIATRDGELVRWPAEALAFRYRGSALPPGAVVVRARLAGRAGEPGEIASRIAGIRAAREASQPVRERTGGSTFRNPDASLSTMRAWELIDAAGCRGLERGGAIVSRLHTNFLINQGGATASDLEGLGEEVRARVLAASGISLDWEIRRVGRPGGAG